jgi:hypothetical protein
MPINALIATGGGYRPPQFNYLDEARKVQQLQMGQQALEAYPEERAYQQEQRGLAREQQNMARQKFLWMSEDRMKELQQTKISNEIELVKYFTAVAPLITFPIYGASRDHLIQKNGFPDMMLPSVEEFQAKAQELQVSPEDVFEFWKEKALTTTDQALRQELGMARIESAEKVAGARIEGMEKATDARLQSQEKIADIRAAHSKELSDLRAAQAEERGQTSRQKEARLTIFKLYGMNEYSQYDETTSDKAGAAVSLASQLLKDHPDLDPQTAAATAKRRVDARYKALGDIKPQDKAGWFSKGNRDETIKAVQGSLKAGNDTKDLLDALVDKGWSEADAISIIRKAAGVE